MEVEIKLGKQKTNANGKIEMTRKEFREYLRGFCEDTMMVTLMSAIVWLAEEPEFCGDKPRLAEIFSNVNRIVSTTLDPNEPFDKRDLARVTKEVSGVEVHWKE